MPEDRPATISPAGANNMSEDRPVTKKVPRGPERFFYDKATHTGTHTRGGPNTGALGVDMKNLTIREKAQDDQLHRNKRSPRPVERSPRPAGATSSAVAKATKPGGGGPPAAYESITKKDETVQHPPASTTTSVDCSRTRTALLKETSSAPPAAAKKPLRGPERFFYDKSTHTGAASRGGVEASTAGMKVDMKNLADRDQPLNDQLHRRKAAGA